MRYLENRNLIEKTPRKIWAFVGDGETDEVDTLGAIGARLARKARQPDLRRQLQPAAPRRPGARQQAHHRRARRRLPRRRLERHQGHLGLRTGTSSSRATTQGLLLKRMEECVDGDYQAFKAKDGAYLRSEFFGKYPELLELVERHDRRRALPPAAAAATTRSRSTTPTSSARRAQGRPDRHSRQDGQGLRPRPAPRRATPPTRKRSSPTTRSPPSSSASTSRFPEDAARRARSTARRPTAPRSSTCSERRQAARRLHARPATRTAIQLQGARARVLHRMDRRLERPRRLHHHGLRQHAAPPHEGPRRSASSSCPSFPTKAAPSASSRPSARSASTPPRARSTSRTMWTCCSSTARSKDGQILEEGITEAGSMASFTAAGTAYSNYRVPMIPFYMYYSMFGFQRIGDMIWAFADSRGKGFLMGGTAGRTTMLGEGLQHQDGHSHVLSSTVPTCLTYDPALRLRARRHPAGRHPPHVRGRRRLLLLHHHVQRGLRHAADARRRRVAKASCAASTNSSAAKKGKATAQLFGSGPILNEALRAQEILAEKYGVHADVWSVTSYNELRRDALAIERWNRLHPAEPREDPYIVTALARQQRPHHRRQRLHEVAARPARALARRIAW